MKKLVGQDKDREITQQLPLRAKQIQLRGNLLYCQLKQIQGARNKKTTIKTPPFLPTFPRLNFTPVQTSLPNPKWHKGMGVTTGTHRFLSSTPSFSPFSSTPAWALHRPQLLSKKICSSMDSALAAVLPEHPSAPARVLHRLQGKICSDASFSAVSHSFCSPLLCPPDIF